VLRETVRLRPPAVKSWRAPNQPNARVSRPGRRSGARSRLAEVEQHRPGERDEPVPGQDELAAPYPAADDDISGLGDLAVDEDRPVGREADRGDAPVLHRGLRGRVVRGGEGDLAYVEVPAYDAVDVGPVYGENQAGRPAELAAALADHEDAVGGGRQQYAVPLAERGGVGQCRVDLGHPDLIGIRPAGQGCGHGRGQQIGAGQGGHGAQHCACLPGSAAGEELAAPRPPARQQR